MHTGDVNFCTRKLQWLSEHTIENSALGKWKKKKKISLHGLFMIFCSKLGNSKQPCSSQNCMINSTICAVVDS